MTFSPVQQHCSGMEGSTRGRLYKDQDGYLHQEGASFAELYHKYDYHSNPFNRGGEVQAFFERYHARRSRKLQTETAHKPTGLQTPLNSDSGGDSEVQGTAVPGLITSTNLRSTDSTSRNDEISVDAHIDMDQNICEPIPAWASPPLFGINCSPYGPIHNASFNGSSSIPKGNARILRSHNADNTQHYELDQRGQCKTVELDQSRRYDTESEALDSWCKTHCDPRKAHRCSPEALQDTQPGPWWLENTPDEEHLREIPIEPPGVDPHKWLEILQRNKESRRKNRKDIQELKKRLGANQSTKESKEKGKTNTKGCRGGSTGAKITKSRSERRKTRRS